MVSIKDPVVPSGSDTSGLAVDFRHVVYSLSDALDLVGVDDVGHGKRVGAMAASCAEVMGLPEDEVTFLFELGKLHDIGVSSTVVHAHLATEFDWKGSQKHCEVGYALLRDFKPLSAMALPIRYHHTPWEDLSTLADLEVKVAEYANLIFLVDRADVLAAPYYGDGSLLMNTDKVRNTIQENSGTYFSPQLVEQFLEASASEAFWLQLAPNALETVLRDRLEGSTPRRASMGELKQLGEIFSSIVDAKSPFTAEHSLGVARLARFIAERMGIGSEGCDKLEVAGLLHDVGKLRVPDKVLDKPGKLSAKEFSEVKAHSFETFRILSQIKGFEEIAKWAAYHHEGPDGTGYPFHLDNRTLSLEARILRVADIFQAMVQDRPYRKGLSSGQVLAFMNELVSQGNIEEEIVASFSDDMDAAISVAIQHH